MKLTSSLLAPLSSLLILAQSGQAPPVISPEVHPDRRVTFRITAPDAKAVSVRGEWMSGQEKLELTKDEKGLWSGTSGPLAPQRYSYSFNVDGASVSDPRNPAVKGGVRGHGSVVTIPGTTPAPWELRDIPHGALTTHWYKSKATGTTRSLVVYTPPGYDAKNSKKYPVLYLLHGSGDTDREWASHGNANWIADAVIAEGKAIPMLIVMPDGHPAMAVSGGTQSRNTELMGKDLMGDVIPLIESSYRTDGRRALAGLSMGGMQTIEIGLLQADKFPWLGVFSAGVRDEGYGTRLASAKAKPKLLWVAIGEQDRVMEINNRFLSLLKENKVEHEYHPSGGGHTWINWREYLAAFLPKLFR